MKPLLQQDVTLQVLDNAYIRLGLTPLGDLSLYSFELRRLATLPEFDSVIDKLLAQQEAMHRLSNLLMASILNGEHYELEVIGLLNKGELK